MEKHHEKEGIGYKFVPKNENYVNEITYNWRFNGIYSFCDIIADEEDLKEFVKMKKII